MGDRNTRKIFFTFDLHIYIRDYPSGAILEQQVPCQSHEAEIFPLLLSTFLFHSFLSDEP